MQMQIIFTVYYKLFFFFKIHGFIYIKRFETKKNDRFS
jgi:hypothetical protein